MRSRSAASVRWARTLTRGAVAGVDAHPASTIALRQTARPSVVVRVVTVRSFVSLLERVERLDDAVESSLADELKKPADDFRLKDLFDARAFNTTRVEVTRQGATLAFEKDKENWKQVAPSAKAADAAKVEALLTALTNARASGFEPKAAATGLDTPELTATITFDEGKKTEKVAFGKKGTDAFARRDGDTVAAKIDASTLDSIIKAFDALK
jgi:hypothetical protein